MANLTKYDESMKNLIVLEEETLLNSKGFIDKDDMYKIMRHLAEKLSEYERAEEQGLLHKAPVANGTPIYTWYQHDNDECYVYQVDTYSYGETECMYGKIGEKVFLSEDECRQHLSH